MNTPVKKTYLSKGLPKDVVDYIYTHVLHCDYTNALIQEYHSKLYNNECECNICYHAYTLINKAVGVFAINYRASNANRVIYNINLRGTIAYVPKNYF